MMFERIMVGRFVVQYLSGNPGLSVVPVEMFDDVIQFNPNDICLIVPPYPVRKLLPLEAHRAEIERLIRVEIAVRKSVMPKAIG